MTHEEPKPQRGFTGLWIPRDIIEADLSWTQRLLWSEINALHSQEHGGCFASNAYLANVFGLAESTIANSLVALKAAGWLKEVSFDGRRRVIRAVMAPYPITEPAGKKPSATPAKSTKEESDSKSLATLALAIETTPSDPCEVIWKAYPRKVGKAEALPQIRKALKEMPLEELLKRVQRFARSREGEDPTFTKHPSGWFRNKLYHDYDHDPRQTTQPSLWD